MRKVSLEEEDFLKLIYDFEAVKDCCVTIFLVEERPVCDGIPGLWNQDSWSQNCKFEGDDWNFKGSLQDWRRKALRSERFCTSMDQA